LIYQVLWLRMLALVFGVTVYAASTVLAAFMAGLATGSALADRVVSRVRRPLVVFGVAEILIGISALLTPVAFDAATGLYARLYPMTGGSLPVLTVARLITGFVVLLVPTILMGMTLPVLSASILASAIFLGPTYAAGWRTAGEWQASAAAILPVAVLMGLAFPIAIHLATARDRRDAPAVLARRVGRLYAVDVVGAIIGALLGGFLLLPWLGAPRARIVMAALFGASALLLVLGHPARTRLLAVVGASTIAFGFMAANVPDPFSARVLAPLRTGHARVLARGGRADRSECACEPVSPLPLPGRAPPGEGHGG
jgi:hypothetical protein